MVENKTKKESIWDYWISKLLFPKTFLIDKPGIIISKISSKYGNKENKRRMVFFFEETLSYLQKETLKKIGKERTEDLWYKIGKDFGVRYLFLSEAKKPPRFLLPNIINYIFDGFKNSGFSIAETIKFNSKTESLILEGKDNAICRKSNIGGYSAGIISAFLSFLCGKNIEAKTECVSCPSFCKLIANPHLKKKHIPDLSKLKIQKDYLKLNFTFKKVDKIGLYSFSDFVKFKKIKFDESGKIFLEKEVILPVEMGFFELISKYYNELNLKNLFEQSIIKTHENISRENLKDFTIGSNKINFSKNILSILGWGILNIKKEKENIGVILKFPPWTGMGYSYLPLMINGFLNDLFNKKFAIKKIWYKKENFSLYIQYNSIK